MNTDSDFENMDKWIKENEIRISSYLPKEQIDHLSIRYSWIIRNVIKAIKVGDLNAIELGCELTMENRHIPFGKCLKSDIFNALKDQVDLVTPQYREALAELAVKYLNDPYPPKDGKKLYKLIKLFGPNYRNKILDGITSNTEEAQRWVTYLSH